MYFFRKTRAAPILLVFCLLIAIHCWSEIIDRIVAVVNEQVITLIDLRITEEFGFHDEEIKGVSESPRHVILDKLIIQKLVIQLSSENVLIAREELVSSLNRLIERIGVDEFQKKMREFGLVRDDLYAYIREKAIYQKIISRKFSQGVIVVLKEIEDYYYKNYIPSQKEKGLEPQPMLEMLDEIESIIKREKVKKQVNDWIENLKKKAEIQIRVANLE